MSSYFNYTALPILLSLEEVFSYTAARYLPLPERFCPNWEEALFGPTMGKSVSSVFQTHFTHTTWGTTQIFIPRLLLGSRAILAFFECTADKTPDTELTRNYSQNSKCLKLSTIHLLNMLDNSCTLRGFNYVFPSLETASKLEQNKLTRHCGRGNKIVRRYVPKISAAMILLDADWSGPLLTKRSPRFINLLLPIYFGFEAPSFVPQSQRDHAELFLETNPWNYSGLCPSGFDLVDIRL